MIRKREEFSAKLWGMTFGLFCVTLSFGCAPGSETLSTTTPMCSTSLASITSGPGMMGLDRAKVSSALKKLTDESTVVGADKAAALRIRQLAALLVVQNLTTSGFDISPGLAEVRDSIEKIPGVVAALARANAAMAEGKARSELRRHERGGRLMMPGMADTVDYFSLISDEVSALADTSYDPADLYPTTASIVSAGKAAFPTDSAYAEFADEGPMDLNIIRDAWQQGMWLAWKADSNLAPSVSLSTLDYCILKDGPIAYTVAMPGWIKALGKIAGETVAAAWVGAKLFGRALTAGAAVEAVVGVLVVNGIEEASPYVWNAAVASAHDQALFAAVCQRNLSDLTTCTNVRASPDRLYSTP